MLSYRHAFHAGNYPDILKHITISLIIESLKKKDKPFTVIDTHAGAALYNLNDDMAQKTQEASSGILYFLKKLQCYKNSQFENITRGNENPTQSESPTQCDESSTQCDESSTQCDESSKQCASPKQCEERPQNALSLIDSYVKIEESFIADNIYAGSPAISYLLLRENDSLVLSELHNTEIENLRMNMKILQSSKIMRSDDSLRSDDNLLSGKNTSHVELHHRNGFEQLNASVPPKEKRGLVLTDPSYETDDEWLFTGEAIARAHKKWQTGIFAVWYPLLEHRKIEISTLKNTLRRASDEYAKSKNANGSSIDESHILFVELNTENTTEKGRLYGSGMCIINPPYLLKEKMETILPFLANTTENASFSIEE